VLVALGRNGDALAAFERARALDPDALLEATIAQLAAHSSLAVGRADFAIAVLTAARPATDAAQRDRGELLLADAHQVAGPPGSSHARALYGAASPRPELAAAVTLGLALALHRAGEIEPALAMARRLQTHEVEHAARSPWLPPAERAARLALWLTAVGDAAGADRHWREAAEGGNAYADHARSQWLEPARKAGAP
jgi:hypothetical protein